MSNTFDPTKKREKVHWLQGRASYKAVLEWGKVARMGARVLYHGEEHVTESHAGLDRNEEAAVFINGVHGPVPLRLLTLLEETSDA